MSASATAKTRPSASRQASNARFSSRPVPQTTVTSQGEESRISFLPEPSLGDNMKSERPSFSRQSSLGKFSSRPVPETQVNTDENQPRTITFADTPTHPRSTAHSRHHSRQGSGLSSMVDSSEVKLSIPDLLESYRYDGGRDGPAPGGSSYSTQGFALSFNDLPSRAQHLILNELLRQNSKDTAVLLTTLPIPSEGTCLDDVSTMQYLSDVEVLCNELPPTLMVLSNNMTVTVSL
jgi:solute carrier family 12 (potassium/chloride transporters), member 9